MLGIESKKLQIHILVYAVIIGAVLIFVLPRMVGGQVSSSGPTNESTPINCQEEENLDEAKKRCEGEENAKKMTEELVKKCAFIAKRKGDKLCGPKPNPNCICNTSANVEGATVKAEGTAGNCKEAKNNNEKAKKAKDALDKLEETKRELENEKNDIESKIENETDTFKLRGLKDKSAAINKKIAQLTDSIKGANEASNKALARALLCVAKGTCTVSGKWECPNGESAKKPDQQYSPARPQRPFTLTPDVRKRESQQTGTEKAGKIRIKNASNLNTDTLTVDGKSPISLIPVAGDIYDVIFSLSNSNRAGKPPVLEANGETWLLLAEGATKVIPLTGPAGKRRETIETGASPRAGIGGGTGTLGGGSGFAPSAGGGRGLQKLF